ncbi:MAG: DNRLRE domain-containing protein [Syntrophomonas sp.]|uniref:DNRLRE domain-containing protein n=1 Tax=Syntrophomonas sp. TaxID=2053627 RepID=UPI0026390561|nr:DNRLRE domain-containing protein [Syntrophomonas sp.]MDD4626510.1 DNRLRE domain-containing protein [Syntrophomonas sp.]
MNSKDLNSMLATAMEKKSKLLELYQDISSQMPDPNLQEEITQNILSSEKKHAALLQKLMQKLSDKTTSVNGEKSNPARTRITDPETKNELAINDNNDIEDQSAFTAESQREENQVKVLIITPNHESYISKYYANHNYRNSLSSYIGRDLSSGDIYHSLLHFDMRPLSKQARIIEASLILNLCRNEVAYKDPVLTIRPVIEAWNESTVTWNTQPQSSTTQHYSTEIKPKHFRFLNIDISDLAREWHQQPEHNQGFIITGLENNGLLGFRSKRYFEESKRPILLLEFTLDGY